LSAVVHVDHSKLDDLRALDRPGNEGFLVRIATVFLDDAGRRVEAIEKGIEEQDAAAVQMAAHALKGSCSYLGATQLAELCRVTEERAEEGDLEGGGEALAKIRDELATVSAVLTEEMKKA
jgi:HPt (histidine-containing phosphotransfer) domain-containing protein